VSHLTDGLYQCQPNRVFEVVGREFSKNKDRLHELAEQPDEVISLISRIQVHTGQFHLAIMNLHPESDMNVASVINVVDAVTGNMPGYLLSSGRHFHFYGLRLLDQLEWCKFLASWLMPTIIVSPRYIGHCLYREYAALRLTTSKPHKPVLPYVISTVNM